MEPEKIRDIWTAAVKAHPASGYQPTWSELERWHPASVAGWTAVAEYVAAALRAAPDTARLRDALMTAVARLRAHHRDNDSTVCIVCCDAATPAAPEPAGEVVWEAVALAREHIDRELEARGKVLMTVGAKNAIIRAYDALAAKRAPR